MSGMDDGSNDGPGQGPEDADDFEQTIIDLPAMHVARPVTTISHIHETDAGPSVDDLVARLVDISGRFELQGEIAHGAMGRILAAWDLHLGRPVAIKVLRKTASRDLERIRFLEEAQVTGQLQHPNIMPVYELGRLRGELAFVMRRIEGRSLKEVIALLRKGEPDARRQFGRMRILTIFQQLCLAVGFAHTRAVVHRDLKPSNVMVGDFGEVVLLDWGLCKIIGAATRSTRSTTDRWRTVHGQIIGTPAYMAPEQAMGLIDHVDPRTDVYGLGAILYHLLTLRPPFAGKTNREIVQRVIKEPVQSPRERAPDVNIPIALDEICMRCLARSPGDRFANARALADAIAEVIDRGEAGGSTAIGSADLYASHGIAALTQQQSLLEDTALVRDELQTARHTLSPDDPPELRQSVWEAEARLRALEIEVADAYARAVSNLTRASALDPDNSHCRQLLCDLFLGGHTRALTRGDEAETAHYRRLIAEFDDGRHAALVAGKGSLLIEVQPKGANVWLSRFVERQRLMVPVADQDMGPAPIKVDGLHAGAYRLVAQAADCETLVTTLMVQPGQIVRLRLRMLRAGAVPPGFVHVPAGTFRFGDAHGRFRQPSEQALPDYAISRTPVTATEYLQFLRALATRDPADALPHVPRTHDGRRPAWAPDGRGQYLLPDLDSPYGAVPPDSPVVGVTHASARLYCRWATEQRGMQLRLPTEEEWEKAARGAEGRVFPWGRNWEPGYAAGPETCTGPWPPPVAKFEQDCSALGVRDLAGGAREWTASTEPGRAPRVVVRGGSFLVGANGGRPLWARDLVPADRTAPDIGFRLVGDVYRGGERHPSNG